jgi:ubiquinone/menaquinone biosynthesis C-methylase UbiE
MGFPGQKEHFNAVAHAYDESIPRHVQEHYLDKRLRFFSPFLAPGAWICSVGAGTGSLERAMGATKAKVVLADQSEEMCRLARRKGLARVVCADAAHLPFKPGRMRMSYSVAAYHHIIAPEKVALAVEEMHRILVPGGALVIWDHNLRNPYWKIIMAKVPQDTGDERIVPLEEFRAHFNRLACRWSVAYSGWMPDFAPKALLRPAKALEWLLERLPVVRNLGAHNVFVARKGLTEAPAGGPA